MVATGSVRSKLIVSHLAVIALVFALTALVASVPIRRAQERAEEGRLSNVAETIAIQIDVVTRPDTVGLGEAALRGVLTRQATRTGTRILIVDERGSVAFDTARTRSLAGTRITGLDNEIAALRRLAIEQEQTLPAGRGLAPISVVQPIGRIERRIAVIATTTDSNGRTDALYPVVMSPEARLPVIDRYVRSLVVAAGIATLTGIGASLLLARSIARPITRLTETASAISVGNLTARAEGEGDDEIGRLVRAFNAMVDRLATTYASQRALLANIAHELRTPLTSVRGYAQALRDNVLRDDERSDALAAIRDEAERMDELVNQILQLSRLESGQLPLQRAQVDIAALVRRLARDFAPRAAEAGVAIDLDVPDELRLHADDGLLAQALGNLVANALRHTPPGGSVSLRVARLTTPGSPPRVRVRVADTGSGIAPEDLPHIFDRFYRGGPQATAGAPSGPGGDSRRFGLGLAIAREIVARHGGTIAVESELGRGTTFTLDLPVEPDETDDHA